MTEPRQRLFFDLPHSLARDAEQGTDLFERHRLVTVETEIEPQNLRLTFLEVGERFFDRLGERLLEGLLVGRRVERVREVVEQLVVLARRERRIEREMGLRD